MCTLPLEYSQPTMGHIPKENWLTLSQKLSVSRSASAPWRVRLCAHLQNQALPSLSLYCQNHCEFGCAAAPELPETSFLEVTHHFCLLQSYFHFLRWSLSLGKRRCDIDVLFRAEDSKAPFSLNLDLLWVYLLIIVYCRKNFCLMRVEKCTNIWVWQ